jgi:hypothetical protein
MIRQLGRWMHSRSISLRLCLAASAAHALLMLDTVGVRPVGMGNVQLRDVRGDAYSGKRERTLLGADRSASLRFH